MSGTGTVSGFKTPSVDDIKISAKRLGLTLSEDEMQDFAGVIKGFTGVYVETANAAEPLLPVKYPRMPGYRPSQNENTHNAWYWKTDIKGTPKGLLAGKKIAIKDNVAVAGVPMTNGSRIMEGYVPEFDATVVTRILDAGGHIVGKAVCEDLCLSGSSNTSLTGPVLNPHDKQRTTGGSSSGSAALVGLKEVDMAIGGDQGGSIRGPASFCGIVGLKPTYGLVPYTGAAPVEPTLDHLGPMANNVEDIALLLQVIAGPDGNDFRQLPSISVPKYSEMLNGNVKGIKIGAIKEGFVRCDHEVSDVVQNIFPVFEKLGAKVEWISVPELQTAEAFYTPVTYHGLWQTYLQGDCSGLGHRGLYCTSMSQHFRKGAKLMANDLAMPVRIAMLFGSYIKGGNMRRKMVKVFDDLLEKYDVLYLPTKKQKPDKFPTKDTSAKGHPALSINVGYVDRLPIGAAIVGKMFDETTVLNVAYAIEQEVKRKDI